MVVLDLAHGALCYRLIVAGVVNGAIARVFSRHDFSHQLVVTRTYS